ncbi:MAG: cupin domain-containing protein [Methyloligellaceae bacterium]
MVTSGNLYAALPRTPQGHEIFETLTGDAGVRIERIVSTGQTSAQDDWYDQAEAEWVTWLRGAARLLIEGEDEERALGPGDWLLLPAHCRHRVTWTSESEPTVWLAVHYGATARTA